MKYLIAIVAALGLAAYAFVTGYSVCDHQDANMVSRCAPESIVAAKNPDARYSHCRDKDWDGSTLIRDRLAEADARPDVYGIIFQGSDTPLTTPLEMTTEDELEPRPPILKPSPAHRGSL